MTLKKGNFRKGKDRFFFKDTLHGRERSYKMIYKSICCKMLIINVSSSNEGLEMIWPERILQITNALSDITQIHFCAVFITISLNIFNF